MQPVASKSSQRDLAAAVFALFLPSFITWLYFYRAAGAAAEVQLGVFNVVKAIQFGFPLVWVLAVQRERIALRPPHARGLVVGLAFGAAVAAAMFGLYYGVLKGSPLLGAASAEIVAKVRGWGIDRAWKYAALGVFYTLLHSLLEEYYWRWFVFGRLRKALVEENVLAVGTQPDAGTTVGELTIGETRPLSALSPKFSPGRRRLMWAVTISALGFMAHHVLVLGKYFGFASGATWLLSGCVAIGGVAWAWLYDRTGSLLGPWVSHLLVDAAIFLIGYDLVKQVFGPGT